MTNQAGKLSGLAARFLGRLETPVAIERRNLLVGLAAASTLAAGGTAAGAMALSAADHIAEDPELLRLLDVAQARSEKYQDLWRKERELVAYWGAQWPLAPSELISRCGNTYERGVTGGALYRDGRDKAYSLHSLSWIETRLEQATHALTKKRIREGKTHYGMTREEWEARRDEAERLLPIAKGYWNEIDRIKAGMGEDYYRPRHDAATNLTAAVASVLDLEARTMEGLVAKAQALRLIERMERTSRMLAGFELAEKGSGIAKDLIRLCEVTA